MMRDPNTDPIPAPDPATPTVAAPAPMNLAALSMSCLAEVVWRREVAWAEAGLMLLMAARARRGDTDRRAMADIFSWWRQVSAEKILEMKVEITICNTVQRYDMVKILV